MFYERRRLLVMLADSIQPIFAWKCGCALVAEWQANGWKIQYQLMLKLLFAKITKKTPIHEASKQAEDDLTNLDEKGAEVMEEGALLHHKDFAKTRDKEIEEKERANVKLEKCKRNAGQTPRNWSSYGSLISVGFILTNRFCGRAYH